MGITQLQVFNPGVVLYQRLQVTLSCVHGTFGHPCLHDENWIYNGDKLKGIRQRDHQPRLRNKILHHVGNFVRTCEPFSGHSGCDNLHIFFDVFHLHHYIQLSDKIRDTQNHLVFLDRKMDSVVCRNLFSVLVSFCLFIQ